MDYDRSPYWRVTFEHPNAAEPIHMRATGETESEAIAQASAVVCPLGWVFVRAGLIDPEVL